MLCFAFIVNIDYNLFGERSRQERKNEMEIKAISVPLQGVVGDYVKGEVQEHFDYSPTEEGFTERLRDLRNRHYAREKLVSHLLQYNGGLNVGQKTIENIQALLKDDTYVVIGGQQAGLLTGPLYTIHKIISIVQLAKEKEESLGVRVVPVFWIAGEDHDIDEINHVFVSKNEKIKKTILHNPQQSKMSASRMTLSIEECQSWIEEVFKTYPETNHTNEVLRFVNESLLQSHTYVDFFANLVAKLFKDTGLILVDAHHPELRQLEISCFEHILTCYREVQEGLRSQQRILTERGYKPLIETKENAIHLFIQIEDERILLEEDNGRFIGKDGLYSFSFEELMEQVREHPERFSNNVVTRPLMQEYVFPTLAFIGGPGEVAYWSELQQVFHVLDFKMPPVVPRVTISYLERHIEADIRELHLSESDVFVKTIDSMREKWLEENVEESIEQPFAEAMERMRAVHEDLQELVQRVNPALQHFSKKNEQKILEQIQLLERTLQADIKKKYEVQLGKFRRIEHALRPLGAPQERVWNVFYYLNRYGLHFVEQVLDRPFRSDGQHHIIKL